MRGAQTTDGIWATAVSVVMLLIGASTVFAALESALQQVWGGREALQRNWRAFGARAAHLVRLHSRDRLPAAGVADADDGAGARCAATCCGISRAWSGCSRSLDFLLSIGLGTGLVALMYRYLPAKRLAVARTCSSARWSTALLFHLGRWGIGLYLGHATQPTAYGAAASFAALLLWLYYSAQIFLFGAEFTACLGQSRTPKPLAPRRVEAARRSAA